MRKNPSIYEINTRVWIKRFGENVKLHEVPDSYWDSLKAKGIDLVWLMGIWKTRPDLAKKYCFEEGLVREYSSALKDWKEDDVIGSPYAIDEYTVNPVLGDEDNLLALKLKLNEKGMGLILDFIPNHFHAESKTLKENPEVFLTANEDYFNGDSHTFYKPFEGKEVFAHGRDPFFPAWQDTVQVNYFSTKAREFMIKTLIKLTKFCDGVRCDMAMLNLNNIFKNTWGGVLENMGFPKPDVEFWQVAIEIVKGVREDFLLIAEAYWDLEYALQQLGFDYTYDKKLTDRLRNSVPPDIRDHLLAKYDYQEKSVRFLENHDEERAFKTFGKHQAKAAATIISTLKGMKFYHDGQFEGKRIKLPVQLGREPNENDAKCMTDFYAKLLAITKEDVFKDGEWKIVKTFSAWDGNESYQNIIAWLWEYKDEKRLVIVNYSDWHSQCRIMPDVRGYSERVQLKDLFTGQVYNNNIEDLAFQGLFIDLRPFQSHIFAY